MGERIQTSTPLIYAKFIPPPPRKLWAADSPTEQLYWNKWTKYRNLIGEKDPWSSLDSPHFIDFKDLPDSQENDFDDGGEEIFFTPQKFPAHQQRLLDMEFENNNLLEELKKCTLSAIKPRDEIKEQETDDSCQFGEIVKPITDTVSSLKINISSTIKEINEEVDTKTNEHFEQNDSKNIVEEKPPIEPKADKKTCTIVEPFSFENREKFRKEHIQARRERDSIGKETWKGFRATPRPNFLKARERILTRAKTCPASKDSKKNMEIKKTYNATEIWKKKPFQPAHPNKVPIVPRAPNLMTAARAIQRQRFEEKMRKKELEQQELKKKEEAERMKREAEEIAKLRRELVHKAQPIRKYKLIVPKVTKRELPDPVVPLVCKRQRKI